MLLEVDQVVNQAAKWHHMLGGQVSPSLVIRAIINRGGEQGAHQHSQALHSWFTHIPGLRVVMPATATDACDLLIAATLSNDPVLRLRHRSKQDRHYQSRRILHRAYSSRQHQEGGRRQL